MKYPLMNSPADRAIRVPVLDGGINTSADATQIEDNELTDAQNVWFDNGVLKTRNAFRMTDTEDVDHICNRMKLVYTSEKMYWQGELSRIMAYAEYPTTSELSMMVLYVVSENGEILCQFKKNNVSMDDSAAIACVNESKYGVPFFAYIGGVAYKPSGNSMVVVDANDIYVPTIFVNATPYHYTEEGAYGGTFPMNGDMYEGFNSLTAKYKCQFTSAASKHIFVLPKSAKIGTQISVEYIAPSGTYSVTTTVGTPANMVVGSTTYTITSSAGSNHINVSSGNGMSSSYGFPDSDISNNVTVTAEYEKTNDEKAYMAGATISKWFGGANNERGGTRLFLSGFVAEKECAKVVWSDVENPLYFSENNYAYIGDSSQPITAIGSQASMLVVFKQSATYCMNYVQGEVSAETVSNGLNVDVSVSSAKFPVTQISPEVGCDCKGTLCLCQNRLVWMNSNGEFHTLITNEQYSERNIREFGVKIKSKILADSTIAERKSAKSIRYNGWYITIVGNMAYMFNDQDYGFLSLSSYYTHKYDGKIAWYAWRFENVTNNDFVGVIGSDEHLTFSIMEKGTANAEGAYPHRLYTLSISASDSYNADEYYTIGESGEWEAHESGIQSYIKSKRYDFGSISRYKRIKSLFVWANADSAKLVQSVDGEDCARQLDIVSTGEARMIPCNVSRCRSYGVTVKSASKFELLGIEIQYAPCGQVR